MVDNIKASITFDCKDDNQAKIFLESLELEAKSSPSDRVSVEIKQDKKQIISNFIAKDFVALRAAMNSYLKWFKLINESINL